MNGVFHSDIEEIVGLSGNLREILETGRRKKETRVVGRMKAVTALIVNITHFCDAMQISSFSEGKMLNTLCRLASYEDISVRENVRIGGTFSCN